MTEQILNLDRSEAKRRAGLLDRSIKRLVLRALERVAIGELTLIDGSESRVFGQQGSPLRASITVLDPRFYRALLTRGPLGGAEAFMDGHWTTNDLTMVIRIMAINQKSLTALDKGPARFAQPAFSLFHSLRRNTREGSRRNIGAHYDLSNEFFQLFLDPTMTYSSGIFESEGATMEQASIAKYERVCQKLRLGPDDHVLEIGSGWGGFAIHAARHYGCRVTTITISEQQHALASERIREQGLEHLIELRFEDYRDLEGTYDKLVSIEMIEAVGADHLDKFFEVCGQRLAPDGLMCIQAITHRDQDYERSLEIVDFIKRYIFPGGQLVSVGAMVDSTARTGDMRLTHLEDITPHYAETLARWRDQMNFNIHRMHAIGLSDRFLRMWEFYLCYCEAGFLERNIGTVQVVFERKQARRAAPLGRLSECENEDRQRAAS